MFMAAYFQDPSVQQNMMNISKKKKINKYGTWWVDWGGGAYNY